MQDLADELGVSESRISQLRAEALLLLKDGMNSQLEPDVPGAGGAPQRPRRPPQSRVLLRWSRAAPRPGTACRSGRSRRRTWWASRTRNGRFAPEVTSSAGGRKSSFPRTGRRRGQVHCRGVRQECIEEAQGSGRAGHGGEAPMRINTNIMALNAYRNLNTTNDMLGEQPREAVVGLPDQPGRRRRVGPGHQPEPRQADLGSQQVATQNAQDGISVVQTAEGALTQVNSMLQRIHDLIVQSANTGVVGLDRSHRRAERDRAAPRRDRPDR